MGCCVKLTPIFGVVTTLSLTSLRKWCILYCS